MINCILNPFEFKKYLKNKLNHINETKGPHSYGCIMGYIDGSLLPNVNIDLSKLYSPDTHGIEQNKHVTVLYGLLPDIDTNDVLTFLQCIKCPSISLTNISLFENEEYDVVKYDVDPNYSTIGYINKITTLLFPFENKFPDYHPHVTEAYLLPGEGKSYINDFKEPIVINIDYWVYSTAANEKWKVDKEGNIEKYSE